MILARLPGTVGCTAVLGAVVGAAMPVPPVPPVPIGVAAVEVVVEPDVDAVPAAAPAGTKALSENSRAAGSRQRIRGKGFPLSSAGGVSCRAGAERARASHGS